MKNQEIPSKIWELKCEIVDCINNNAHSNNQHMDYKSDWNYLAIVIQSKAKQIQELIDKYEQPKYE